jgi:hypothetical protein
MHETQPFSRLCSAFLLSRPEGAEHSKSIESWQHGQNSPKVDWHIVLVSVMTRTGIQKGVTIGFGQSSHFPVFGIRKTAGLVMHMQLSWAT